MAQDWSRRTSPPTDDARGRAGATRAAGHGDGVARSGARPLLAGPHRSRTAGRLCAVAKLLRPRGSSPQVRTTDLKRSGRARWEGEAAPRHVRGRPPKSRCAQRVSLWAVDRWPLATIYTNQSGASPGRYPPPGVTGRRASSSLGSHVAVRKGLAARALPRRKVPWGTRWGQLDGLAGPSPSLRRRARVSSGRAGRSRSRPFLANYSAPRGVRSPRSRPPCPTGGAAASRRPSR